MTHRELIKAVLNGEQPEIVPCWGECPMDVTVFRELIPSGSGDPVGDLIAFNQFFDNSTAAPVGIGFAQETISSNADEHIYKYETGAVWHEKYQPTFSREAIEYPINTPEEVFKYHIPDINAPGRFDIANAKRLIQSVKDAGYFVEGSVLGAWYGIYYYIASFENILMWMAVEPEAAHALFEMNRRLSIQSAKLLIECGVDCIFTASDLGSGNSLLFSRQMFYEYVYPWLKELAAVCHDRGVYLHLHSHGHIEDIMDGIVDAGVDILNPVGPSDHNDLAMFKKKWGDKITLHGGISTTIAQMSNDEIVAHVASVMDVGCVGGRFIPRTESGIPPMPMEKARFYVDSLKTERKKGYHRH